MIPDATIPAKHFKAGRAWPVRLLVIHTTEGPCAAGVARKVAEWFGGAAAPEASAHFVVGPDETIACVDEADTAWHAPPVNGYAIGVEHCGRAAWTAEQWAEEQPTAMLARAVELVADICTRHGIPAVFVDAAGLVRGDSGITTHAQVSLAFHQTTHTDPGAGWPMDAYLDGVRACSSA